jgi:MFS family permease
MVRFSVLRGVGAARLIACLSIDRVAGAGLPVAFVVTAAASRGYGQAAGLQGLMAAALAVSAPLRARILDRFGAHRALIPQAVLYILGLLAVAATAGNRSIPWFVVAIAVVVTALSSPPIDPAVRIAWRRMSDGEEDLKILHTVDSIIEESGFLLGPILASALMLTIGRTAALFVIVALIASSRCLAFSSRSVRGILFAQPDREMADSNSKQPSRKNAQPSVLQTIAGPIAHRTLQVIVAPLLVMGLSFGLLAISIPALAAAHGSISSAGFILAAISLGGVLGGVLYGMIRWSASLWTKQAVLSLTFAVPLIMIGLARSPIAVGAVLALCGLSVTPLYINSYLLIDGNIPQTVKYEANTWVTVGNDVGYIVGIWLGGILTVSGGYGRVLIVTAVAALVLGTIAVAGLARPVRSAEGVTSP